MMKRNKKIIGEVDFHAAVETQKNKKKTPTKLFFKHLSLSLFAEE